MNEVFVKKHGFKKRIHTGNKLKVAVQGDQS